MTKIHIAIVMEDGSVKLPAELQSNCDLRQGDYLEFAEKEGTIFVRKCSPEFMEIMVAAETVMEMERVTLRKLAEDD